MVIAAIFMIVAAILISVGAQLVSNARKESVQTNLYVGEAENVARAGLVDALGYLRRHSGANPMMAFTNSSYTVIQTPVWAVNPQTASNFSYADQAFEPQINTTTAQLGDTIEPLIGLVNEYSVDSQNNSLDANAVFFGRYEVYKQPNPFPTPPPSPNTAPTYTPLPYGVSDVTASRITGMQNGDGVVWNVTSTGYIYKRVDKSFASGTPTPGITYFPGQWKVPYNQYPNKVVATAKLSTEFRKLQINLPPGGGSPVTAGVYCYQATNINISNSQGLLLGPGGSVKTVCDLKDASGGSCPNPTGFNGPTNFSGGVTCIANSNSSLADSNVFGMSVSQIRFIADKAGDSSNPLDLSNSQWGLYYYNGSVTWGYNQPAPYTTLNTSGILVVNGDLNFTGSNGTGLINFAGIIFCTGNVTVQNGTEIDGCIIMGTPYFHGTPGTVTLSGTGSNFGQISCNPGVVGYALNLGATYREDVSERRMLLAVPNI